MDPSTITLPQTLFTVSDLSTLAGLVVAVYVIVSFFKEPFKKVAQKISGSSDGDWIVRPFTVVVALGILIWLIVIQGTVTVEAIGLAVINAFLVALIAGAAHDYIVAPSKAKADQKIIKVEQGQLDLILDNKNTIEKYASAIRAGDRGEEPPSTTI
jgi:uncharacterized membrane protein